MSQKKIYFLLFIFIFLIIAPTYYIAKQYGLIQANKAIVKITADFNCENLSVMDIHIKPEGNDLIFQYTFRSRDGFGLSELHECDDATFNFHERKPDLLRGGAFYTSSDILKGQINTEKGENGNKNTYYFTFTNSKSKTLNYPTYQFRYNNIIKKQGLSNYSALIYLRKAGITTNHEVTKVINHYLELPLELSITKTAPNYIKEEITDYFGSDDDFIRYTLQSNEERFLLQWENKDQTNTGIIFMLFLSAIFGVGISGFMELTINLLNGKVNDKSE